MEPAPAIRPAGPADADALFEAVAALTADLGLGAEFRATRADLAAQLSAEAPLFQALLAGGPETVAGAVVFFPEYSTLMGRPGLYVQDLWVAPSHRGTGLGRRLLAAAARRASAWGAAYLKLSVHGANAGAARFYDRLGLAPMEGERTWKLEGAPWAALLEA